MNTVKYYIKPASPTVGVVTGPFTSMAKARQIAKNQYERYYNNGGMFNKESTSGNDDLQRFYKEKIITK